MQQETVRMKNALKDEALSHTNKRLIGKKFKKRHRQRAERKGLEKQYVNLYEMGEK